MDLARLDLERGAGERCKGFVVGGRLEGVSGEAVRCGAFVREEELRRCSDRCIEFVGSPDGRVQGSTREVCGAFWAHFRDRFARCPDFPVWEFRNCLADFPRLGAAEAASCGDLVAESGVCDALGRVGFGRSPGLDGLLFEVCPCSDGCVQPLVCPEGRPW